MTEPSTADRLAALQARRRPRSEPSATAGAPPWWPDEPSRDDTVVMGVSTAEVRPGANALDPSDAGRRRSVLAERTIGSAAGSPQPDSAIRTRWSPSWFEVDLPLNRMAVAGASVVSFASMIVAMGPILATDEATETEASGVVPDGTGAAAGALTAPAVEIEVAPGVQQDQSATAEGAAFADDAALATDPNGSTDPAAAPDPGDGSAGPAIDGSTTRAGATGSTSQPTTVAGQTAAPATAPPTTGQPTTAAPATAAAVTKPPATSAPTTAPQATTAPTPAPTTAPPTTQPPTTVAPTTAPPTTKGSGG